MHRLDHAVSFGDCDPAGIVFYPNVYGWFDRTFHDWLRGFGGHAALCARLDVVGLGLMASSAEFRRPMRDGDLLSLVLSVEEWGRKSLRLAYEGSVGGEIAVVGSEVRGLFRPGDYGMVAVPVDRLREIVESDG